MALGCSYDNCNNTNKSVLHWDLILNQTKEYGGGEIWLDGVKVRENGKFILPELVALNPTSKCTMWIYMRNNSLDKALSEWKATKPN